MKVTSNIKLESHQKPRQGQSVILSASVPTYVQSTAIHCAEILGYPSISSFVKDAICEKIETTGRAVSSLAHKAKTSEQDFLRESPAKFNPATDF